MADVELLYVAAAAGLRAAVEAARHDDEMSRPREAICSAFGLSFLSLGRGQKRSKVSLSVYHLSTWVGRGQSNCT